VSVLSITIAAKDVVMDAVAKKKSTGARKAGTKKLGTWART
jgi:hypothetical protein